jgi:hypothetical protein
MRATERRREVPAAQFTLKPTSYAVSIDDRGPSVRLADNAGRSISYVFATADDADLPANSMEMLAGGAEGATIHRYRSELGPFLTFLQMGRPFEVSVDTDAAQPVAALNGSMVDAATGGLGSLSPGTVGASAGTTGTTPGTTTSPSRDFIDLAEIPSTTVPANTARLFARDNGAGKTQLLVQFATGAAKVLATED